MNIQLSELTDIKTGIYKKPDLYSDILYLQAKHFDEAGEIISAKALTKELKSDQRIEKHLLQNNDIIFAAKGDKNFAFLYQQSLGKAVASSTFFVIRIKKEYQRLISTGYLQWYLNHPLTQSFIKSNAKGTALPVISKTVLADLEIPVPPMDTQKKISEMDDLWQQEKLLIGKILLKKNQLYQTILYQQARGEH
jgi:restriction endonuclease S subunit